MPEAQRRSLPASGWSSAAGTRARCRAGIGHCPFSDLVAEERRIGIRLVRAPINGNDPEVRVHIEKGDPLRTLHDLKGQGARAMARDTADDAQGFRIDGGRQIVLKRSLSGGGQRQLEARQVLADVADRARGQRTLPETAQIGMSIGGARRRPRRGRRLFTEEQVCTHASARKISRDWTRLRPIIRGRICDLNMPTESSIVGVYPAER